MGKIKNIIMQQAFKYESLLKRLGLNGMELFFYRSIIEQRTGWRNYQFKNTNYYEFGVGWGRTMTAFATAAVAASKNQKIDLNSIHIFGFDSFEGLPESTHEADKHRDWGKGVYSYSEEYVLDIVTRTGFPNSNIHFIKGYYENTLTSELKDKLKDKLPSIITIDCDYYSSTKTALTYLEPILLDGTFFYFDDIWSFNGHPDKGELKAISEFNGKQGYLTKFELVGSVGGRAYIFSPLDSTVSGN